MTTTISAAFAYTGSASWRQRAYAWVVAKGSSRYDRLLRDYKRELFGRLEGRVLELGPGTGPNLKYLPRRIDWMGIEPNPAMHPYLRQEAERLGLNIELREGTGEQLPVADSSMDAVICTLVLCSVKNPAHILQEILRILKPGGHFLFLEHVAAPRGTRQCCIQDFVQPFWTFIDGECHPNCETRPLIEQAGFDQLTCKDFQIPNALISPHIRGVATKKPDSVPGIHIAPS